jgi:exopolysaccharide biosynthesis polyprenyl glycosylphosphotransferase
MLAAESHGWRLHRSSAEAMLLGLDAGFGLLLTIWGLEAGLFDGLPAALGDVLRGFIAGLLIGAPLGGLHLRRRPGRDGAEAVALALGTCLDWLRGFGLVLVTLLVLFGLTDAAGSKLLAEPAALLAPSLVLLAASMSYLLASRILWALAISALVRRGVIRARTAILGSGTAAEAAMSWLEHDQGSFIQLVGLVHDGAPGRGAAQGLPVLGALRDVVRITQQHEIDLLVLAPSPGSDMQEAIEELRRLPVRLRVVGQELTWFPRTRGRLDEAGGRVFIEFDRMKLYGINAVSKRGFDLIVALLLLVWLLPAMLLIGLAIRLESPGPALFRQPRRGFRNRVFHIYKFRTMRAVEADIGSARQTRPGDQRLTRLGAFLRRHSIDELPQLIHVLRGDMSLVGPRPHALLTDAAGVPLEQASRAYLVRSCVRPGITGLAQVNGWRGELDTLEKLHGRVEYDIAYIVGWSFWMDLRILLQTMLCVIHDRRAW